MDSNNNEAPPSSSSGKGSASSRQAMIQAIMKDRSMTPQERQKKIQDIMRPNSGTAPSTKAPPPAAAKAPPPAAAKAPPPAAAAGGPEPAVRPGAMSVSDPTAPRGKGRRMTSSSAANGTPSSTPSTSAKPAPVPSPKSPTPANDPKSTIKREMDKLRSSGEPSKPGAMSVSSPRRGTSAVSDPKSRIKAEMNSFRGSGEPQGPGAVPVTTSSLVVDRSSSSDPKARIKAEMNALRSGGGGGQPSAPGAVPVNTSSIASSGAERSSSDPKARIKAEMNALRSGGGGGSDLRGPGAVPVTTTSLVADRSSSSSSDPKARIKAEMDALRSGGQPSVPGVMSVSSTPSTGGADPDRPSDAKARIRAEMDALRSGAPAAPGAVSVSASEAASDARTSRAARKARRGTTTESVGTSRGRGGGASGSSSRSPQRPPPGTVDASRAKAEAEKLMDYDNQKPPPSVGAKASTSLSTAEADKLMDYERHKPGVSSEEASGPSMARAQAESNKSFQTAESSKSMPGASGASSKSMGLEEITRQKKEAEMQRTSAEQPDQFGPENGEEIVSAVVVDEDALEAEYQQRLMENVVSAEVMDQKEIDRRNRRRCLCRCCCPLILVAVILGIVIPTTKKDPEFITQSPTNSPTAQAVEDFLAEILEPISGEKIYEEGTPQYQAFNWLLYEDPAMLDLKSENVSNVINRYAFATFYYTTDGPNWNDQLHFLSNRSICDWHVERFGVMCIENTTEPYYFRQTNNDLNGTLPSEISAVSTLSFFNFASNADLSGTLPSELGLLTQLTLFQVAFSKLTGTIPNTFNNLLRLEILSLTTNQLTGSIPSLVTLDHALRVLFVVRNNLDGSIPLVKAQSPLEEFFIPHNDVTGTFPITFFSQPQLNTIDVDSTKMSGTIGPQFSLLSNLENVWMSESQFSGTLPASLGNLDVLKWLRLDNNNFSGTIPPQMGDLDRLVDLYMDGNDFSGTIPPEMAELRDVRRLRLARNSRLEGTIPADFVDGLRDLIELTLEGTRLTGNYLNEAYCQLPVLRTAISANCAGDTPELPCDCCVECCVSNGVDDCELNLVGACKVDSGIATIEERNNTCTCTEDGSQFTCVETCQVCSFDETVCAQTLGYVYTLNQTTGDVYFFENNYMYTKGYDPDTVVTFTDIQSGDQCKVFIDGEECNSCRTVICPGEDLNSGFDVDCTNVGDGWSFAVCDPFVSDPGPLEVFRLQNGAFASDVTCLPIFPTEKIPF